MVLAPAALPAAAAAPSVNTRVRTAATPDRRREALTRPALEAALEAALAADQDPGVADAPASLGAWMLPDGPLPENRLRAEQATVAAAAISARAFWLTGPAPALWPAILALPVQVVVVDPSNGRTDIRRPAVPSLRRAP